MNFQNTLEINWILLKLDWIFGQISKPNQFLMKLHFLRLEKVVQNTKAFLETLD